MCMCVPLSLFFVSHVYLALFYSLSHTQSFCCMITYCYCKVLIVDDLCQHSQLSLLTLFVNPQLYACHHQDFYRGQALNRGG